MDNLSRMFIFFNTGHIFFLIQESPPSVDGARPLYRLLIYRGMSNSANLLLFNFQEDY